MAAQPAAGHRHRRTPLSLATTTAVALLLLSSVSAFALTPLNHFSGDVKKEIRGTGGDAAMRAFLNRRRLFGPGSSPPTCRSKCGWCRPCRPVHVPIQPGLSTPLEYYPEAWRCKCGNKLFMP